MHFKDDYATAAQILKQAVAKMRDHAIAPHPVNYTLWYSYMGGALPDLNQALEKLLASPRGYSDALAQGIFHQHITGRQAQTNQKALLGITEVAASLLQRLNGSLEDSAEFDQVLSENLQLLRDMDAGGELAAVVDLVAKSAEAMAVANRAFRQKTEAAKQEVDQLKVKLQATEKLATKDGLTQLYNRTAFDRQLAQLLSKDEVAVSTALILLDLDHFKRFNDDYGHLIGDRVLQKAGEIIQLCVPDNTICARYGGEEFALLVTNTSLEGATGVAEEVRKHMERLRVRLKNTNDVLSNITGSFGVALYKVGEGAMGFIDRADKALYRAKDSGRNRVEVDN